MRALILEGEEPVIDANAPGEAEDRYMFLSPGEERRSWLELTVELATDASKRILIMADGK